ncbi:MAG TPA: TIGR03936 family radical SAM-associated protein [Dehalococcoidia bacterium]|nr:TIGR03936 family radical SAM-associated protein [Dehalococcoidia bacterium]
MGIVQRLRLTFSRGEAVKDLSPRETRQVWEQILVRSGVAIAYEEGKKQAALLVPAAYLPSGATSDCEVMEVKTAERVCADDLMLQTKPHLQPGINLLQAREVGLDSPSLTSLALWSEYLVEVSHTGRSQAEAQEAIERLLAASQLPWEQAHKSKVSRYDLRPLVLDIGLQQWREGSATLRMRLKVSPERSGRPEEVTRALGFAEAPSFIHRTRLFLDEISPAIKHYRRAGEPEKRW